jgi:hypothetical protein
MIFGAPGSRRRQFQIYRYAAKSYLMDAAEDLLREGS